MYGLSIAKIIYIFGLGFIFYPLTVLAEESITKQSYEVAMESRIHGSGEQPKMIFILPWRSQVNLNLSVSGPSQLNGYFDFLLQPKSKDDLEYEFDLISKQLK